MEKRKPHTPPLYPDLTPYLPTLPPCILLLYPMWYMEAAMSVSCIPVDINQMAFRSAIPGTFMTWQVHEMYMLCTPAINVIVSRYDYSEDAIYTFCVCYLQLLCQG